VQFFFVGFLPIASMCLITSQNKRIVETNNISENIWWFRLLTFKFADFIANNELLIRGLRTSLASLFPSREMHQLMKHFFQRNLKLDPETDVFLKEGLFYRLVAFLINVGIQRPLLSSIQRRWVHTYSQHLHTCS
jgi:hypothetical protein